MQWEKTFCCFIVPVFERHDMSTNYLSDTLRADGTRVIVKPDGVVVTIPPSGTVTVDYPVGHPKRRRGGGRAATTKVLTTPRRQHTPPDFSHLPAHERPVNVGSRAAEPVAQEMTNFTCAPFVLDGRTFASVEGFYVWLKWSGVPEKQAQAQALSGYEAKRFGKSSRATTAVYDGTTIILGSPEHHAFMKRALRAKLAQHPDLARRFAATYPRPIMHDLGYPENPKTRLPAQVFVRILTELRQELVDGTLKHEA
jgi:hypothetical protein